MLDLGCGSGSFEYESYPLVVIALDVERPAGPVPRCFVEADAARLPFENAIFDAVISNHSLEHIANLDAALKEIGRILKRPGKLYVAVPDSRTLSDRLYRWLARGGGHVNPFRSPEELAARIGQHLAAPLAGIRPLYTSLSFLNKRNHPSRAPRGLWLLGGGNEWILKELNYGLRWLDCHLGTRLSQYGWALFFGEYPDPPSQESWPNVCVRCGAGHPSGWLHNQGAVRSNWLRRSYVCPDCGATNYFTSDEEKGNRQAC